MPSPSKSLNWLHFSGLHFGPEYASRRWRNRLELLRSDLAQLHGLCGPWDLVCLTGNLVLGGSLEHFEQLNAALAELWETFEELGSAPVLLAVPGSFDLVAPSKKDEAAALVMRDWANFPEVHEAFWSDPLSKNRVLVDESFRNFAHWQREHPFPRPRDIVYGLLPGEFSATLTKGEVNIGIVGLNSCFLQLENSPTRGALELDSRQFHRACRGDGHGWIRQHRFNLLLTHDAPAQLARPARQHFRSEIAPPRRFALHLYGPTDAAEAETRSFNESEAHREFQGYALIERSVKRHEATDHHVGYSAVQLDWSTEVARIRFWPRVVRRARGGNERFVQDASLDLEADQGTKAWVLTETERTEIQTSRKPEQGALETRREPDLGARIRGKLPRVHLGPAVVEGVRQLVEAHLKAWSSVATRPALSVCYQFRRCGTTEEFHKPPAVWAPETVDEVTLTVETADERFEGAITLCPAAHANENSFSFSYKGTAFARGRLRTLRESLHEFLKRPEFVPDIADTSIYRVEQTIQLPAMRLRWGDLIALEDLLAKTSPLQERRIAGVGLMRVRKVRVSDSDEIWHSGETLSSLRRDGHHESLLGGGVSYLAVELADELGGATYRAVVKLGAATKLCTIKLDFEHENALEFIETIRASVNAFCEERRSIIGALRSERISLPILAGYACLFGGAVGWRLDDANIGVVATMLVLPAGIAIGLHLMNKYYPHAFFENASKTRFKSIARRHILIAFALTLIPVLLVIL